MTKLAEDLIAIQSALETAESLSEEYHFKWCSRSDEREEIYARYRAIETYANALEYAERYLKEAMVMFDD